MKAFTFLSLGISVLPIWLSVLSPISNPKREACISTDMPVHKIADAGSSSVTLNGVEYPFDNPPYSGGTVRDEGKYERRRVGGKDEYPYIKTGKRTLHFIFNHKKNGHTLTATIYFDGKTGESRMLEGGETSNQWAGKPLRGLHTGKLRITSLKKIEAHKYLMSGTFEKDVNDKSGKYHFEGQFKDFVVTDLEDPAVQKMINKQTPAAMKKASDEMREDAKKRKN